MVVQVVAGLVPHLIKQVVTVALGVDHLIVKQVALAYQDKGITAARQVVIMAQLVAVQEQMVIMAALVLQIV